MIANSEAKTTGPRLASRLLGAFLERTGAGGAAPAQRRYLWTDAHAVIALLGLHAESPGDGHLARAVALAHDVHAVLGRFAPGDARRGWISGLPEEEGARRPTVAGLRIGKPMPERPTGATVSEAIDDPSEWERDGQYFHYLVKWMHALDRLARATGEAGWCVHGAALARAACAGFLVRDPDGPRLVWKTSVDLSRAVVDSSGLHDAVGGLVACLLLHESMAALGGTGELEASAGAGESRGLSREIALLAAICAREPGWRTADPLGTGELAIDRVALEGLVARGYSVAHDIRSRIASDLAESLRAVPLERILAWPPARRLAFRELGFALGIGALADAGLAEEATPRAIRAASRIVRDWSEASARTGPAWRTHEDIGDATLAACLAPGAVVPRACARVIAAGRAISPPSARDRTRGCTGG